MTWYWWVLAVTAWLLVGIVSSVVWVRAMDASDDNFLRGFLIVVSPVVVPVVFLAGVLWGMGWLSRPSRWAIRKQGRER